MSIFKVKPMGSADSKYQEFSPSGFDVSYSDVSDSDAGNTDSGLMMKNKIGTKTKIAISFKGTEKSETTRILNAFESEYIDVYYWDEQKGAYITRTFYAGDRSTKRYIWNDELGQRHETVSCDIIERSLH